MKNILFFSLLISQFFGINKLMANVNEQANKAITNGFTDAADFGFLPTETGINNTKALQAAVDRGGTIVISKIGTYKIAGTVYIGDSTSLIFGNGTSLQKVDEKGKFGYVLINKGAMARTFNYHISVTGLTLKVNKIDTWMGEIFGLRGQVAFFYVKDLKIEHFRCTDLWSGQFCIHICTFEDLLINDVIVIGKKDGIHLGRGNRFSITNCVFKTDDDAIALAAGGWVSGNPEIGNLENGLVQNCYDLKTDTVVGTFAKIGAGAWLDWTPGMEVRYADPVVSGGKIYRVLGNIDGKVYKSITRPAFETGTMELDGIKWIMSQKDTIHSAVNRNIVFRDIFSESLRAPFQLICYDNNYCHSYHNGAPIPVQSNISFDNINILNNDQKALAIVSSPIDFITVKNSTLKYSPIVFLHAVDFDIYPKTFISFANCTFRYPGNMPVVINKSKGKEIYLKTLGSLEIGSGFSANVEKGQGTIIVQSDLTGLVK